MNNDKTSSAENVAANSIDETVESGIDFGLTSHPADLALALERVSLEDSLKALRALPLPWRAETFSFLRLEVQAKLAKLMDSGDLVTIVTEMNADDRADLFNSLTPEEQQRLLPGLAHEEREDVCRLASHAEGTAGAIMTSDFATLSAHMTTREAIDALRLEAPGKETIYRSYILDSDKRLIGSIRLHALILAAEDSRMEDIMQRSPLSALRSPLSVSLETDQEMVAQMIARFDVLALGAVN